jgi:hypothetical protein
MTPLAGLISTPLMSFGRSVRDRRHHTRGVTHQTVLFPGKVMTGDFRFHRLLGGKGAGKDGEECKTPNATG